MLIYGVPLIDVIALTLFVVLWVAYTIASEHRSVGSKSLSTTMMLHRRVWMRSMCDRDNRISDASLLGNLMRSVSFLASASILVLGGLIAVMGAGDRAFAVYQDLPFADQSSFAAFELKIFLLAVVFVYAFFQFTWSLRQFNYCCILVGSAPPVNADNTTKEIFATHAARLQTLGANTFNRGLRAYYFALAMIMWFAHAWAFMIATALVLGILYRREFRSKSLSTLAVALHSNRKHDHV